MDEPARLCPIIETALQEASLEYGTPAERAQMVAYCERVKTCIAWEIIALCCADHLAIELIGAAMVRLHTGQPMPEEWNAVDPGIRAALTKAILGKA